MRKIVWTGAAIAGLAVVGLYGASLWVQHRAVSDVDAALATLRASGVTATHGPVAFDFWTRSLSISDLAFQAPGEGGARTTIVKVQAIGLTPQGNEVSADRVEVTGFDAGNATKADSIQKRTGYAQTIPKLVMTQYSGPAALPAATSVAELLGLFAKVKVASISMPQGELSFDLPKVESTAALPPGRFEYTLTNAELKNVRDGHIGALLADKIGMSGGQSFAPMTGSLTAYASADIDVLALASLFGVAVPARAPVNGYVRIQGKTTSGPYTVKIGDALDMTIDALSSGEIAIDPTKINSTTLAVFSKLPTQPGARMTPAQTNELTSNIATLYEGAKFTTLEMRGMRMSMASPAANGQPAPGFSMSVLRMTGFEKGRMAQLSIDDTAMLPPGMPPVKIGHASITGMDFAKIMRLTAQMPGLGQPGAPDKTIGLLSAFEGFEVRDYDVPDFKTGKIIGRIEGMKWTWGPFINGLPAMSRLTMKVQVPVDERQPGLAVLQQMGLDKVWIACDVGTKWVEDKQALALEPFEMDIENVGRLSAKVSLTNPNRLPAVLDMGRLAAAFQAMEIGPVAVKVRDSGLVKLFKANLERQAAAGGVAANPFADAKQRMMAAPVMNVGGITLADAASRFTETSGQTMTITLTPKAAVSIAQLTAPGATAGPDAAALLLDQFTVEAAIAP